GGITQALHGYRPVADAVHIEEVCFGAERQKQMIKLEFKFAVLNNTYAMGTPRAQINRLYLRRGYFDVAKNPANRIHDVTRIKISGCHFMQHRRKQNKILATDQRHLYVRSTREPFVEVHCRVEPGKSATGNDYSGRLHPISATCASKTSLIS